MPCPMRHFPGLAGLLLIAALSACTDPSPSGPPAVESSEVDTVSVDYAMAEEGLAWLELVASGADDETLRAHFFERVAPTEGRRWRRR